MQARQEGSDPVADWRHPSGLARHCSGGARHRQQDSAYLEEERCVTHRASDRGGGAEQQPQRSSRGKVSDAPSRCPAGHAVRLSLSSARVPGGRRAQGRHDHGRACRLQKAAGGAPHRLSCEGLHHLSCERPLGAARLSPFPCLVVGLSPELPEDLYCLIKKAVSVRKHLDKFRQDKDAKFRLILIESRIHRIARYYKLAKALPPTFKYESATASTLVS